MRKVTFCLVTGCMTLMHFQADLRADASGPSETESTPHDQQTRPEAALKGASSKNNESYVGFTGKITRNKVRMRLQPNLDSPITRELNKDDLLVIVGESGDFYAVRPPEELKAYIYRTYVLDNVVEGTRVNVRLEPNTEAPVVAQLNTGDRVEGVISPLNSKWLEIPIPATAQMYVSKDYVENIGDAKLMETLVRRKREADRLLDSTQAISQAELQKPFNEINLQGITNTLNKFISGNADMPAEVERAKLMLTMIQESYLQKKIAYLEAQAKNAVATSILINQDSLTVKESPAIDEPIIPQEEATPKRNEKMAYWEPIENERYEAWLAENPEKTKEDFYNQEKRSSIVVRGILESYDRHVKNKPGDYLLVNKATRMPIAYVYSTQVDLHDKVGQDVVLEVTPRPNNNFAFPAYYVLSNE